MAENLMDELWQKFKMLDAAIKELRSRGSAYAQAEQDYRVELAKCILLERETEFHEDLLCEIKNFSAIDKRKVVSYNQM